MSPLTDIVPCDGGVLPIDIQEQGTSQVIQWVKNPPDKAGDTGDAGSIPRSRKIF